MYWRMYSIQVQPLPSLGPKSEPNLPPRFPNPPRGLVTSYCCLHMNSHGAPMWTLYGGVILSPTTLTNRDRNAVSFLLTLADR